MKYIYYIVLLSLFAIACKNENQKNTENFMEVVDIVSLPPEFYIEVNNPECITEFKRAANDAGKGILVCTNYTGIDFKHHNEIKELLKEKSIQYKPLGENCTGEQNCYGYYMDSLIKQKYGKDFLNDITIKAHALSDSRWETKIYNFDEVDENIRFLNDDIESPGAYISKDWPHPENWDFKPIEDTYSRQYIMIEVVVDTLGKATGVANSYMYNLKKSNEKHLPYLKKEIKKRVEALTGWQPALLNKHKVKCTTFVEVSFN